MEVSTQNHANGEIKEPDNKTQSQWCPSMSYPLLSLLLEEELEHDFPLTLSGAASLCPVSCDASLATSGPPRGALEAKRRTLAHSDSHSSALYTKPAQASKPLQILLQPSALIDMNLTKLSPNLRWHSNNLDFS